MYSKITFALVSFGLAVVGIIGQKEATVSYTNDLTLASLDAFTNPESNPESNPETSGGSGSTIMPPDPWNYVPGRYIVSTTHSEQVVCPSGGSISIGQWHLTGDYKKGDKYSIVIETKNCDGENERAWCDQRQVGSWIIEVKNPEK